MITKHGLFLGYAAMPHTARLATGFAVLALAAMFSFTGCPTEDNDDDSGGGGGGNTGVGLTVKTWESGSFTLYALTTVPTAANVDSLIASAAGQSVATTTSALVSVDFLWATGKQPADGTYYLVVVSSAKKRAFSDQSDQAPTSVSIVGGKTTAKTDDALSWPTLE